MVEQPQSNHQHLSCFLSLSPDFSTLPFSPFRCFCFGRHRLYLNLFKSEIRSHPESKMAFCWIWNAFWNILLWICSFWVEVSVWLYICCWPISLSLSISIPLCHSHCSSLSLFSVLFFSISPSFTIFLSYTVTTHISTL